MKQDYNRAINPITQRMLMQICLASGVIVGMLIFLMGLIYFGIVPSPGL